MYKFCDGDINNFCLMLRKGVDLYEYTNNCQRFSHCHISKNVIVTSQDIADEDYKHAKRGRI